MPDDETAEDTAADIRAGRHARRLFQALHSLTASSHRYGAMARELGLDRRAVRKYARAGLFRHGDGARMGERLRG
ncbi:hypothetical protein [Streptomyces sp. SID12488]|uniref:hypothetical protein n=1 Tax=Streptomyces sp. SID12488 TaxID=2706040 RepID=UPI0013D93E62|nr:hypothetical protein [Streptomyces sp. SID12488]NEA67458.1 hypothetical protein [Streptomyces sp. SID12488]